MVDLRYVLTSLTVAMLRSQVAVLTGVAMGSLHYLISSWNTSLNGSMILVSSTILEGICLPDVDIRESRHKCIKSTICIKNANMTWVANGVARIALVTMHGITIVLMLFFNQ